MADGIKRCSVEGCDRSLIAQGLCSTHYARWQRLGAAGVAAIRPRDDRRGMSEAPECLTCSSCGETKPIEDFAKDKAKKYGRRGTCRVCHRAYWNEWRQRDGNREKNRAATARSRKKNGHKRLDYMRRRLYGLEPGEAERLLEGQDGRCAICKRSIPLGNGYTSTSACIDHDHETGAVRGLLCRKCNAGLGMFGDDPERLEAAANYLRAAQRSAHGKRESGGSEPGDL